MQLLQKVRFFTLTEKKIYIAYLLTEVPNSKLLANDYRRDSQLTTIDVLLL